MNFHKYRSIFCFLSILIFHSYSLSAQDRFELVGSFIDAQSKEPMIGVLLSLDHGQKGGLSNEEGKFHIKNISQGKHIIVASYIGYQSIRFEVDVQGFTALKPMQMHEQSLELEEVVITAVAVNENPSTTKFNQIAVEYTQASSLSELLNLVPGGMVSEPNLNQPNQIHLRQIGTDGKGTYDNSASGTAVILDGLQLSNDANLQSIPNSSNTDNGIGSNINTVNSGIDLRQISVEQIASVEIIRGIPSVAYGNLTSGVVKVETQSTVSPLQFRLKANTNVKDFSVNKGFSLSPKLGTVYASLGYLNSKQVLTDPLKDYERINANLNHGLRFGSKASPILWRTSFNISQNIDNFKEDPESLTKGEYYKNSTTNTAFNTKLNWFANRQYLSKINFEAGFSLSKQYEERDRIVSSNTPVPISLSQETGYNEGMYLPSEYMSHYTISGLPLNTSIKLNALWNFEHGNSTHELIVGAEHTASKNFGDGTVYNPNLPPYPTSSTSSRPRAFHKVPALNTLAFYVEDRWKTEVLGKELSVQAGLRASRFFVDQKFTELNKVFAEPRVNARYSFYENNTDRSVLQKMAFRVGYGQHVKTPSLAQLYPQEIYYDIVSLNYFSQDIENSLLWLKTESLDPTNEDLELARTYKWETGLDFETSFGNGFATYFYEQHTQGYDTRSQYLAYDYLKYDPEILDENVQGKPQITDFTSSEAYYWASYNKVTNTNEVTKTGLEFSWQFNKIRPLNSTVSVSGAWMETFYGSNGEASLYRPSAIIDGEPFPYVGVYKDSEDQNKTRYEEFRTSVQWLTHIPKLRLAISLRCQTTWYYKRQESYYSGLPMGYYDAEGNYYAFTEESLNDPVLKHFNESLSESYFKENKETSATDFNLNIAWEASEQLSFSFLVNRIMSFYQDYTTNTGVTISRSSNPYFSAEMRFKF